MWKKEEQAPAPLPEDSPRPPESPKPTKPSSTPAERATIGRSITIRGEVEGEEDLLIQGQVDGSVELAQHSVTVGREGRVKANISGRLVTVEGEVEGDLEAEEQVVLHSSARVKGDITAPRVVLEDGASFRGLVNMGETGGESGRKEAGSRKGSVAAPASPASVRKAPREADEKTKETAKANDTSRP